jgi:hypothetical protein
MNWSEEFKNALAYFAAAPANIGNSMQAAAEWVWEVLQGDFAEEPSTAQIVTGTVIAMIPIVDQICDVRDLVANCKKIYEGGDDEEGGSNFWNWVALAITIVGLFPELGSFFKGCFKVLFKYLRNMLHRLDCKTVDDFWNLGKPFVEASIAKLNEHLANPAIKKLMSVLRIDNPYKAIAAKIREFSKKGANALLGRMDDLIGKLRTMTDFVEKWGGTKFGGQVQQMWKIVWDVRNRANAMLGKALAPAQDFLERLARRLDVEDIRHYQATTNVKNLHLDGNDFLRTKRDEEIAAMQKKLPKWADALGKPKYPELKKAPKAPKGFPSIDDGPPGPLKAAFKSFHDARPDRLPEGARIYRVMDPKSNDNSYCWMSEEEFKKLRSKDDWRRRFAVWVNWNHNGEYVVYTVPPGGLPVWRGTTASQQLLDESRKPVLTSDGKKIFLEGGAEQIVLHPDDLDQRFMGKRELTGWGYDEFSKNVSFVGVPITRQHWYVPKANSDAEKIKIEDDVMKRHGLD